jgi:hypothetical protein
VLWRAETVSPSCAAPATAHRQLAGLLRGSSPAALAKTCCQMGMAERGHPGTQQLDTCRSFAQGKLTGTLPHSISRLTSLSFLYPPPSKETP